MVVPHIVVYPLLSDTLPPATTTNATFIGDHTYIVIDPATSHRSEQERFDQIVQERSAKNQRLLAVVLTHHHPDHVADAVRVAQKFDVPIWAHAETAKRVPFRVNRFLKDEENFILEGNPQISLQAIFTPGHAPGHLCFYEPTSKTLVAGDMVASFGTILIDPRDGHLATYMASLNRLLKLDLGVVIPAHGKPMEDGRAKIEETLAHRLLRVEQVLQFLPKGHENAAGAEQIAQSIYARELPKKLLFLATRSVLATAIYLCEQGQVKTDKDKALFWR